MRYRNGDICALFIRHLVDETERKCHVCKVIEDRNHILEKCTIYNNERRSFNSWINNKIWKECKLWDIKVGRTFQICRKNHLKCEGENNKNGWRNKGFDRYKEKRNRLYEFNALGS